MDDNATIRNLPIYKAAINDDWDSVAHIFDTYPDKLDEKITIRCETPLHIAIGTNTSHCFVKNIVNKIVNTDVHKLRSKNCNGNTALHYAAKIGNTIDAKLLVSKDPGIAQVTNTEGHTALKLAAWYGRHDTLWYLLEVTKDEPGENGLSPYSGVSGADLVTLSLTAGFCG
ncbi:uncharacterized protein [Rutidosis leptorrhynchoides]|uniref:uncharacterized protein n=1 Tax=Rutidosis leptorrhynchoides TaxID=125765 RepID=UPI003A9A2A57